MKQRAIEDDFFAELTAGSLKPLLDYVQSDDTLELELRGKSVNIYYRGGSLFKIYKSKGGYKIFFNFKYCQGKELPEEPTDPETAVKNIPFYKQAMDRYFRHKPKYEREFQQLIVRENNNIGDISRGTDYYIIDIEYANKLKDTIEAEYDELGEEIENEKSSSARFDMVALKWLSNGAKRKNSNELTIALIEVKYGDGALKNGAGVGKHLQDFKRFLSDSEGFREFCEDMAKVFSQKCEMGLVDGLQKHQLKGLSISTNDPEVIFVFANHDPDSTVRDEVVAEMKKENCSFPVLIANSSNMGYCLYANCMDNISKG